VWREGEGRGKRVDILSHRTGMRGSGVCVCVCVCMCVCVCVRFQIINWQQPIIKF
jgi:hypothetical protein